MQNYINSSTPGFSIAVGGTISMQPQDSRNTVVEITGDLGSVENYESDGSMCGCGITANAGWARIRWSGGGYTFSISRAAVTSGLGDGDQDWTYELGYFDQDDNTQEHSGPGARGSSRSRPGACRQIRLNTNQTPNRLEGQTLWKPKKKPLSRHTTADVVT